jgi:hypothetical protein
MSAAAKTTNIAITAAATNIESAGMAALLFAEHDA